MAVLKRDGSRKKRDRTFDAAPLSSKKRRVHEESVLTSSDEGLYKPKMKETRASYEAILAVIQQNLGGQPLSIVTDAADEVLAVLKDDRMKNPDKKNEIDKLLMNPISSHAFDELVSIGRLITDYHDGAEDVFGEYGVDGDVGVAVDLEENEEEESDLDMVLDDKEDDDDAIEVDGFGAMEIGGSIDDDEEHEAIKEMTLNAQDIDAYWLQRKISRAYDQKIDPQQSQKLCEEVLEILAEGDDREVETKLLVHLQFDKFSLIRYLLRNRLKVVWCTRLARAEDQEKRNEIEEEMLRLGPDHAVILEQLHATRATAKERQKNMAKSIREEAQRLKNDVGGDGGANSRNLVDRDAGDGWLNRKGELLDLDSLAFREGGLLMANKKCELPVGTYRNHNKGYEEVHVPAPKPMPLAIGEKLVKISDMPDWAQPAFKGMSQLNRVQSRVYAAALFGEENILLCAPTGAGKTNVAMLTILQQIGLNMNADGTVNHSSYKIVYVAPMKALVAEVVSNLSRRLEQYGVRVKELSGDQALTREQIEETQIIVTTPEKWDIITRKSGDRLYTQLVKLLIIDEIHLLHDSRGPVLESIIARTVRQSETMNEHIRLVGLSATLPNYEDVAIFLRVKLDKGLFHFDNSYRPVPLAQQYIGIKVKKPLQRFQLMNNVCYEKVIAAAGKHQVLIFVHSRKETAKTARAIRDTALANDTLGKFLNEDSASREILQSHGELVKSSDLKDLLPYGFAIHHAGIVRADRQLVEELFADGNVQVLVSTATLAWGVNLPAHTVIIKGTRIYNPEKGAWTELSPLDVMQMLGRAGRPQYDTYGEGIVITEHSELQYYLSLMNQQLPIESQFINKLADQLNAEIVLGTLQNAREACQWLLYTYLFVRMVRNPTLYGLTPDVKRDKTLEERRADLIHSAATLLHKNNLVKYDRRSGYFQATELGRIASYYYITHGTISTYNEHLKPTMGDIELCRLFSLSEEFKYVTVRQDEKMELAKLLDRVPIPIRESLEEPSAKINVLLQAYISQLKLEGLSLASDMVFITQSAGRLMRALFEIVLKRGWAQLAEKALKLCKMIGKRMWSVQTPLRQFHGIPSEILRRLEKKDLDWESYYDLSALEIGELVRFPKMGRTLHKFIHQLPKLNLNAYIQPITRSVLKVELTITPDFEWDDKIHGYVEPFWIIVEDNDEECVLHHEYFVLKKQYADEDHTVSFTVPVYEPLPPQYSIKVVSDRWLGSNTVLPISFRHLILPEKYPPPTELLDLQPLPVTALRNPAYEALYPHFKHFNPIQTQVFAVLYNSDDNVLVAAPTGSGKTVCAEFAILRNHQKGPESVMRAVYIAPIEALAKERYLDWKKKFGEGLGMRVVELSGETATDLKLLEKGQIIISTPEKWDALSRRWKQRKIVQQVSLFIVDELHLIGGEGGPVLEIIVSRMRYIASQLKNKTRIVALSASLLNAKDLGDWIGATSQGLFNFPPGVRPVPLEIHIQGINIANFEARMQAMTKPTYAAILQHAKNGKPAIVFAPTRKHARLTAVDLMSFSSEDSEEKRLFLLLSTEELKPLVANIKEPMLKETILFGIGYLHEGLSSTDQEIVKTLFETGQIQVCVMSSSMCWGVSLSAHLVVVMGTQCYDHGRETTQTDYPVTDLLQMMGHASRPLVDNSGKCVILCHAPRKEYYKKFLYEAFPVESHLHHFLHDNLNTEVVVGVVQNKQDALDYLTWTFMYRRLTQNPNYYNLQGVSHRHLSDHLSELVENTISDLEASKCVAVEDDFLLSPLDLGMIASYYYVSYTTLERFSSSLTSKTKLKGLLQILASASEYEQLPIRPGEEELIRRLINHQRFSIENPKFTDPNVKANALLQAHFSRQTIGGNLSSDQQEVLLYTSRLVQAMVDVISSNGWLSLALLAMDVSQMVTQGLWDGDSELLQLPHFTKELANRCKENPGKSIETIFELMEMEDDERRELLQMSDSQLMDIARFCNCFPDIDLTYDVLNSDSVRAGEVISVHVSLERDIEGRTEVGPVDATRYPKSKEEGWWLVVGDTETNQLLAIRKVALEEKSRAKLDFTAPPKPGTKTYTLYFRCDSYVGCDQDYSFAVDVKEAATLENGN